MFERELQAFGLLPQGSANVVPVDQTITATMFRTLTKSLPSASNSSGDDADFDANTANIVEADEVDSQGQRDHHSPLPDKRVVSICDANDAPKKPSAESHVGDKENPTRRSTRTRAKKLD